MLPRLLHDHLPLAWRQALAPSGRPLVVMTPKSLLRLRDASSRLEEAIAGRVQLRYIGRPWRASPSEGYPTAHLIEQDRIVREALGFRGGVS